MTQNFRILKAPCSQAYQQAVLRRQRLTLRAFPPDLRCAGGLHVQTEGWPALGPAALQYVRWTCQADRLKLSNCKILRGGDGVPVKPLYQPPPQWTCRML